MMWRVGRGCWSRLAVALLVLGVAPRLSAAVEVSFPIQLDHAFLRQLLIQQLYTGKNQTAALWKDECSEMILSKPVLTTSNGHLLVTSAFNSKLGTAVGDYCVGALAQSGLFDFELRPQLHAGAPVVDFRVVQSNVYGADRRKQLLGAVWDTVKTQVHPRIEAFRVDLRTPLHELKLVLPAFLTREDAAQTTKLLDSIALAQVETTDSGLSVIVHVEVDKPQTPPTTPTPEPTLTIAEVRRWEAAWQSWDAFLTFIVKRAGRDAVAPEIIDHLRDVLLEARYDLLPALRPTAADQSDPVRPLFLRTWKRLAPVLRQLSTGVAGEAAVRYLSFVTAADALAALDQIGPELGVEISADGLRRLARTVDPSSLEDPTRYSNAVDPDLRKMFGFGPPLAVPELPTPDLTPDEEVPLETPAPEEAEPAEGAPNVTPGERSPSTAAPQEAQTPTAAVPPAAETPSAAAPQPIDTPTEPMVVPPSLAPTPEPPLPDEFVDPPPRPQAGGGLRWPASFSLFASPAWATVEVDFKRLFRWVPARDELGDYLKLVRQVLVKAREETMNEKVEAQFAEVYRNLIFATAWQETCWRQYIKVRSHIQPIASPVGAVGIMQVNSKVWRGFYDVDALRADMAYNARAGSEIVRHYFVDYAIKKGEHKVTGDVHNLARATYSAYNAGPGQLSRYRKPAGQKKGSVDSKFWDKYQQVRAGKEMSVASCYGVDLPPA